MPTLSLTDALLKSLAGTTGDRTEYRDTQALDLVARHGVLPWLIAC